MQTAITPLRLMQPEIQYAESILRKCVHCGFCNATCPTYPLLGSELEGPRGRIYLIKSLLEERIALNAQVVAHLDHCLSCFACETTCPSGVRYSHLIDPARALIEESYRRPVFARLQRKLLAWLLPYPGRFRWALRLGMLARPFRWLLPGRMGAMLRLLPRRIPPPAALTGEGVRLAGGVRRARVTLLTGCAQQVLGGPINDATVRVLTRLGCEVAFPPQAGCCGALIYHTGNRANSLPLMRAAIDRWDGERASGGLDAIVINTSGCGTVVKDYGHVFQHDPLYREKAARVSALAKDFSEWVHMLGPTGGGATAATDTKFPAGLRVAYHDACSLQHAQKLRAPARDLLRRAGCEVVEIPEGHLCCGSAGTYNLLQPQIARELGRQKAGHIASTRPQVVAAGNIGCMEQIAQYSRLPVVHTAQLLDWATGGPRPEGLPLELPARE